MKNFFLYALVFLLLHLNVKADNKNEIEIFKNLRCLVCQGQSIADSNSDFAQTIKLVVKDKIKEGKTKKEIYEFLASKYGEWIVYKPSFSKINFFLWLIPYLTLLAGGLIIFIYLKKRDKS